jgi:hypothetical protein
MTSSAVSRKTLLLTVSLAIIGGLSGCSLAVMAGKMFFGDPKMISTFTSATGVDLTDGDDTLLVICQAPHLANDVPTLEYDLTDGILRRLRQAGVKTVPPDEVSRWLDQNGGEFDDVSELADQFDADYIAVVQIREIRFFEENSRDMLRGFAQAAVSGYEVRSVDDRRTAMQVFSNEFRTKHPRFQPVPVHQKSERVFQKEFIGQLSLQLARQFHDYRMGDDY